MIAVTFNITTATGGAYTSTDDATTVGGQLSSVLPLLLHAVEWVDGTLTDGVDAVLSQINTPSGVDKTLLTLTNANDDAWYYPWVLAVKNDGSTASTDMYVEQVVSGQLKLAVTSGGDAKTGKCIVYLKECK